jgi:hypothetical protein
MDASRIVNSIGLVLDIGGAVLLWMYGLPRIGNYLTFNRKEEDTARYERRGRYGLAALIMGFVLQLASNFIRQ